MARRRAIGGFIVYGLVFCEIVEMAGGDVVLLRRCSFWRGSGLIPCVLFGFRGFFVFHASGVFWFAFSVFNLFGVLLARFRFFVACVWCAF